MISLEKTEKSYPKLKNLCKNSYYSGLLQNLYAGSESETGFFLQLRYQIYHLTEFYPKIASSFKLIAETELKHQEILASAIIMTGGNPVLCNSQAKYFTGRQIDYVKDIKQILLCDIELKEKMVIDYKITLSKIENLEIRNILNFIIKEEEDQLKTLRKLKSELF